MQKSSSSPSKQFGHLPQIKLVVLESIPIRAFVTVPRGQVNAEADPRRPDRSRCIGKDIAAAAFPRGGGDGVVGVLGGPEAEPVMVLDGEDDPREAVGRGDVCPLSGVEAIWGEDGRIGAAGSPLGVGEGVGAEVEEEGHLAQLPLELGSGGDGEEREGRRRG